MMKSALVVWGGYEFHDPEETANLFAGELRGHDFAVELSNTLDSYLDVEKMRSLDLIVPVWTKGDLSNEQERNLVNAIAAGSGIGGWHGGLVDAFRNNTEYQFMTGGQWVSHPGSDHNEYTVNITQPDDPITKGISDFTVRSEQYYLHVDPSNEVLATTTFTGDPYPWIAGTVMPVVWKRSWGAGKVFYCSLGHQLDVFDIPEARELVTRGLMWAAR